MTPDKLRSRLTFVEGTVLKNRASTADFSRRQTNKDIINEEDKTYSDEFDSFFEYEEELSGMKSAAEQFIQMEEEGSEPFVQMEEDSGPFVVMDDSDLSIESGESHIEMEPADGSGYTDVKGFEFIRCSFIKSNDEQCKRQAPKGGTLCSAHRKKV